jgi:AcrR family transcriptional regulator
MPPRVAAPNISDTLSRSARKDFTRASLLQAALTLMGDGRSFTSLGLREIAREAGVVPTAFYRHFRNTDELGLVLVEEVGITLRRLLREARKMDVAPRDMLRRSVSVYQEYVKLNRLQFMFISSERSGGSRILRLAIRNDVTHFTNEMAQDFRMRGLYAQFADSKSANGVRHVGDGHARRGDRHSRLAARPTAAGIRNVGKFRSATQDHSLWGDLLE